MHTYTHTHPSIHRSISPPPPTPFIISPQNPTSERTPIVPYGRQTNPSPNPAQLNHTYHSLTHAPIRPLVHLLSQPPRHPSSLSPTPGLSITPSRIAQSINQSISQSINESKTTHSLPPSLNPVPPQPLRQQPSPHRPEKDLQLHSRPISPLGTGERAIPPLGRHSAFGS